MKHSIELYELPSGRVPIREFLKDLKTRNSKLVACILQDIDLLSDFGPDLREPHVKYVQNGLYELRSRSGSDISRVFYFFFVEGKIILTNGFIKKTQKTPPNEIKKALKYKADYEDRHD